MRRANSDLIAEIARATTGATKYLPSVRSAGVHNIRVMGWVLDIYNKFQVVQAESHLQGFFMGPFMGVDFLSIDKFSTYLASALGAYHVGCKETKEAALCWLQSAYHIGRLHMTGGVVNAPGFQCGELNAADWAQFVKIVDAVKDATKFKPAMERVAAEKSYTANVLYLIASDLFADMLISGRFKEADVATIFDPDFRVKVPTTLQLWRAEDGTFASLFTGKKIDGTRDIRMATYHNPGLKIRSRGTHQWKGLRSDMGAPLKNKIVVHEVEEERSYWVETEVEASSWCSPFDAQGKEFTHYKFTPSRVKPQIKKGVRFDKGRKDTEEREDQPG